MDRTVVRQRFIPNSLAQAAVSMTFYSNQAPLLIHHVSLDQRSPNLFAEGLVQARLVSLI